MPASLCPLSIDGPKRSYTERFRPVGTRSGRSLPNPAVELLSESGLSDRGGRENPSRKVRTPQGRAVGNAHPGKPAGKCHRNDTADGATARASRTGKGEMVR